MPETLLPARVGAGNARLWVKGHCPLWGGGATPRGLINLQCDYIFRFAVDDTKDNLFAKNAFANSL